LQDDHSVYIPSVISSANTIGAVRKERNMLTPLPLVVQKMPIQKALTSGNGNIKFYRESTRSNLKIIPDHKNAIQVYSLFADPPPFLLPSTFKSMLNSIEPTYLQREVWAEPMVLAGGRVPRGRCTQAGGYA
jgi:hypothetical protein